MLSADLGRPVLVDPQPQHCVALGAAALAEQAASAPARPTAGSAGSVGSVSRVGGVRQRVFAATAVASLLVGGAAWSTWPNEHTAPPATAATSRPPGLIGSASTTEAPKPRPTLTKAKSPSKAKPPSLPFTSAVLGIDTKCLDVANASNLDGTAVEVFGCNGTGAQTWTFGKDGTVRALHKCLDGADKDGVLLNTCDGGTGQRWQRDGDRLVSTKSKLCLDVLGKRPTDRAPLVTTACTTTASTAGGSQIWTVQPRKQAGAVNASAAVPHRLRTVTGLGRKPQGVAISPDGTRAYVASVEGDSLAVIDTRDGALLRTIKMPAAPQYLVAAPDGRRLYVTLDRGSTPANSVQVVDTLTGKLLNRVDVGPTLYPPALSPNGLLLYVPDRPEFQVVVVDTFTYLVPNRIGVAPAPQGTAFSPDGLRVYASGGQSGVVSVLDVGTNTVTATIPAGRNPLGLAVSPDGTRLAVADYSGSGKVRLIDTGTSTVLDTVTVGSKPRGIGFAPDGRHLYVANSGSHSVSVIDVQTARISATVTVGGTPWAIAVTPNGKQAYVSDAAGNRVSVLSTGR
jgi:YVTN family beta-propeller protein